MSNDSALINNQPHDVKAIIKGLIAAFIIGAIITVTIIWPAEYAKDPTGIGGLLGLTKLNVKKQSAEKKSVDNTVSKAVSNAVSTETVGRGGPGGQTVFAEKQVPIKLPSMDNMEVANSDLMRPQQATYRSDGAEIKLNPGEFAEYKVEFLKGESLIYSWTSTGGDVYSDLHGDPTVNVESYPEGYWFRYRAIESTEGHGSIAAPFTGNHGWYWLNRNSEPVTIRVAVSGFHKNFHRVVY